MESEASHYSQSTAEAENATLPESKIKVSATFDRGLFISPKARIQQKICII
jgi:hypothetical protein